MWTFQNEFTAQRHRSSCAVAHHPCTFNLEDPFLTLQDLKGDTDEERDAYEKLRDELMAAYPKHLPLLQEQLSRVAKHAEPVVCDRLKPQKAISCRSVCSLLCPRFRLPC